MWPDSVTWTLLADYNTTDQLSEKLANLQYIRSTTNTSGGLREAKRIIDEEGRPGVKVSAMVFESESILGNQDEFFLPLVFFKKEVGIGYMFTFIIVNVYHKKKLPHEKHFQHYVVPIGFPWGTFNMVKVPWPCLNCSCLIHV